jgi:hypothetical protein
MRLPFAAVLLLLAGCETAGRAERVATRQRELHELNEGLPPDRRVVPMTARERDDPLLVDPQSWARPDRR